MFSKDSWIYQESQRVGVVGENEIDLVWIDMIRCFDELEYEENAKRIERENEGCLKEMIRSIMDFIKI